MRLAPLRGSVVTLGLMNIISIDGSPSGARGNTALLLERFVSGAVEAGADVHRVDAQELRIEPCCSRMVCWYKTPGCCIHNDDATDIVDRMATADVWVL